jgi:hypothetical protein
LIKQHKDVWFIHNYQRNSYVMHLVAWWEFGVIRRCKRIKGRNVKGIGVTMYWWSVNLMLMGRVDW